jgi:hypothetical protein
MISCDVIVCMILNFLFQFFEINEVIWLIFFHTIFFFILVSKLKLKNTKKIIDVVLIACYNIVTIGIKKIQFCVRFFSNLIVSFYHTSLPT